MSLKSEMNALADQVRRLCGKSGTMTITAMTNNLKGVSVGADATGATAAASDVLSGKKFVGANGTLETGAMTNNGSVSKTLDTTTKSYTIPAGYHNGSGKVQIETQTKSVTPSASAQTVYPDSGKVLSAVTVGASGGSYSGTFTPASFGKSITINTGKTIPSTAKFALFYDDAVYDHYYWDLSSNNTICALVKDGSTVIAVMPEARSDDEVGSYGVASSTGDVTVTYSGTNVIITPKYDYFFVPRKFKWYVFT